MTDLDKISLLLTSISFCCVILSLTGLSLARKLGNKSKIFLVIILFLNIIAIVTNIITLVVVFTS